MSVTSELAASQPATSQPVTPQPVASYPVHLRLTGRPVLVVGAGNVARRKIAGLVAAEAHVTVIAPWVHPEVQAMPVTILERPYRGNDLTGFWLAITCTDDPAVNRRVFLDGQEQRVWVNSADDPANCAWTLPSVARQGDITITAATNGRSPAMSMWLRRRFETEFDHRYLDLLELLAETRREAQTHHGTSEISGWNEALDSGLFDLVAEGRLDEARGALRESLDLPFPEVVR